MREADSSDTDRQAPRLNGVQRSVHQVIAPERTGRFRLLFPVSIIRSNSVAK
jgi:hypothetical protein